MCISDNQQLFFELVRAGLFPVHGEGVMVNGSFFEGVDWSEVYRLAEEQSVVGLVSAGLDCFKVHDSRFKVPQTVVLQFVGQTLQLEQRNKAMNEFVARLIEKLRQNDIYALLVKGQVIAQCYEKPLWRACGDVDLLLSEDNYEKAKAVLLPLAIDAECEYKSLKHLGMTMKGGFEVELHGMQHSRLSRRIDKVIDEVQGDVFYGGKVRSWLVHGEGLMVNGSSRDVQVFLPAPDEDVIFVFTHILKHFYIEGVGLRQICDWCRLLYTYRDTFDYRLLESRIRKAGLMTEWKAFYNLASRYLGMPDEFQVSCSMFQVDSRFDKKADRIMAFVMEAGNFGHNRERKRSQNFMTGKIQAAWHRMHDFVRHARVFPLDSVKFYCHYFINGVSVTKDILAKK